MNNTAFTEATITIRIMHPDGFSFKASHAVAEVRELFLGRFPYHKREEIRISIAAATDFRIRE